jgi:uncharacterized membrane protein
MTMSPRLWWAILGGAFSVTWVVSGMVWAVVVALCIIAIWLIQAACFTV